METFKQNSLILKEVVQTFQYVKIKYSDKDQFLGDFFERLLNIGIKQTEGQFFTPIPIANFIVNSIPFEKMIEDKIKKEDAKFLPYMIDYACGAGHFITEFMHRIEPILNKYKETDLKSRPQIQNYKQWANNQYAWAHEFVYGIEKDYRLTKTSKIACFLNGDGDANIITGNGLDSFDSDIFENTILYENLKEGDDYSKDHNVFDCVIANPPYSVQDFKDTLKKSNEEPYGKKNFDLFNALGKNSDDIECLFMERAKQLIKEDGYAAIVLANTFLTNTGIHKNTREMILENFKIKGIVELGSGAFMATGTNTIVLFMQKRKNGELDNIKNVFNEFKSSLKDINFNGKTKIISQFIKDTYEDLDYESYVSLFNNKPNDKLKSSDLYEEYYDSIISKLEEKISKEKNSVKKQKLQSDLLKCKTSLDLSDLIKIEYSKIYLYLLNEGVNTIVISAGDTKDEVAGFLGYKFSKRKGDEGLKELNDKLKDELDTYTNRETINSKLYNPNLVLDPDKVNYYIYNNLLNSVLSKKDLELMHKKIKKMKYCALNDLLEYDSIEFNSSINMESKKKIKIVSKYELIPLRKIAFVEKGTSITKKDIKKGNIPVVAGGMVPAYYHNKPNRDANIITVSASGANAGFVNFYDCPIFASDCNTIKSRDEEMYKTKMIYNLLLSVQNDIYARQKGSAQGHIYASDIKKIRLPEIDKIIQENILAELDKLEKYKDNLKKEVSNINKKLLEKFKTVSNVKLKRISAISKNVVAGGDAPEDYSDKRTKEYCIPIYSNGTVNKGLYGYTKEAVIKEPSVTVSARGTIGYIQERLEPYVPIVRLITITPKENEILLKYLKYILEDAYFKNTGAQTPQLTVPQIKKIKIPVPDSDEQRRVISEILPLEAEIEKLQKEIDEIPAKKQAILDKYLKNA